MKKVNQDPFSNGTEYMMFEDLCCSKCIKSSKPKISEDDALLYYTNQREDGMPKCSIERDIVLRMGGDEPIKQKTIDICYDFIMHGKLCPYMKTKRKKYPKKDRNQTELFNHEK